MISKLRRQSFANIGQGVPDEIRGVTDVQTQVEDLLYRSSVENVKSYFKNE